MKENFLENLPSDEKKRLVYIENRPELFETRVIKIKSAREVYGKKKNVLVVTRDPGSANALLPVIKELNSDGEVQITALTDGRAQEMIENNFKTQDVTPATMALGADQVFL